MTLMRLACVAAVGLAIRGALGAEPSTAPSSAGFEVNDTTRPQPVVVAPGTFSTQEQPGAAPSDAVVLFDGKDLSKWMTEKGDKDAPWRVENAQLVCVPNAGGIRTRDAFADVQLHAEWLEPEGTTGESQSRGNSGIFLMGLYELQVLDSYKAVTYPDGMAGAIYGQYPPLANAARPQGQWQTYDAVFHAPKYENGKVIKPATITLLFNGVLVQDHMELIGPTMNRTLTKYPVEHPAKGPIVLQDHHNPIRFRNIWVRELKQEKPHPPVKSATNRPPATPAR